MNVPEVRLPRKGRRWCIMGLGLISSDRSGGATPTNSLRWSPSFSEHSFDSCSFGWSRAHPGLPLLSCASAGQRADGVADSGSGPGHWDCFCPQG